MPGTFSGSGQSTGTGTAGTSTGGTDSQSGGTGADAQGTGETAATAASAGGARGGSQPGEGSINGGVMTTSERVAVLDGALNDSYGDFDGFVLAERARAQQQRESADIQPVGGAGGGRDGGTGSGGDQPIFVVPGGGTGSADGEQAETTAGDVAGVYREGNGVMGTGAETDEVFPPPEDIPSGRDDDVVARQLREAAMREPDPELRERLWDEYRRYTGLSN